MGCIYRWVNLINGKGYTGKTKRSIEERERDRWINKKDSKLLKRAVAKYGIENFRRDIIEEGITDPEYLNEREKYWIAYFDDFHNGYNQTEGGDGGSPSGERHPNYGRKWSEDVRKRMSEGSKGQQGLKGEQNPMYGKGHLIEGEKNWMYGRTGEQNPNYGNKWSEEQRQKQSEKLKGKNAGKNHPMYGKRGKENPNYGKKKSEESRKKMSIAQSGENNPMYGRTGERHPNYGKSLTTKTRQKISASNRRPEYEEARWFFFIYLAPLDTDISEKRKCFFKAFEKIPQGTLKDWFRKWQKELES